MFLLAVFETRIKHDNASASFQAVPTKSQLCHGVHVVDSELDGWTVGRFAEEHVQVLGMLACFEECDVVAGMQVGQAVEC